MLLRELTEGRAPIPLPDRFSSSMNQDGLGQDDASYHVLRAVEKLLPRAPEYLESDSAAQIANIELSRLPLVFRGRLPLTVTGIANPSTILQDVWRDQSVSLLVDLRGIEQGPQRWHHIAMGASLSKWVDPVLSGDEGDFYVSHLKFLLQRIATETVVLGVLGSLEQTGTALYLKPYAIWR